METGRRNNADDVFEEINLDKGLTSLEHIKLKR